MILLKQHDLVSHIFGWQLAFSDCRTCHNDLLHVTFTRHPCHNFSRYLYFNWHEHHKKVLIRCEEKSWFRRSWFRSNLEIFQCILPFCDAYGRFVYLRHQISLLKRVIVYHHLVCWYLCWYQVSFGGWVGISMGWVCPGGDVYSPPRYLGPGL